MPVPSLSDLATRRLIANIHLLEDVGDLPYTFLRHILLKIENPDQLSTLERNCPQLLGHTKEIWLKLIERDIHNWQAKPLHSSSPNGWAALYYRLKRDSEQEQDAADRAFKARLDAQQTARSANRTEIIEGPVYISKNQRKRRYPGGRTTAWGNRNPDAPPKGKTVLEKLRRDVWEHNQARPKAMKLPDHLLQQRRSQIAKPPPGLVGMSPEAAQEQRRAAKARQQRQDALMLGTSAPPAPSTEERARALERAEKEDRLRRLTALHRGGGGAGSGTESSGAEEPAGKTHLPTGQKFSVPRLGGMRKSTPAPAPAQAPAQASPPPTARTPAATQPTKKQTPAPVRDVSPRPRPPPPTTSSVKRPRPRDETMGGIFMPRKRRV